MSTPNVYIQEPRDSTALSLLLAFSSPYKPLTRLPPASLLSLSLAPHPPLALTQLAKGQGTCLAELRTLATRADVSVTEVPYFDVEVRATYGLRALGAALFDEPPGK